MTIPTEDELAAILEAATKGPWRHDGRACVMATGHVDTWSGPVLGAICTAELTDQSDGDGRNWSCGGDEISNAALIALAPDLAAEVLRLRAEMRVRTFTVDHERETAIRAERTVSVAEAARDTDLLFDADKGMLVLHRLLDKIGLVKGTATAEAIADRIVAAHPEFPTRAALRALAGDPT